MLIGQSVSGSRGVKVYYASDNTFTGETVYKILFSCLWTGAQDCSKGKNKVSNGVGKVCRDDVQQCKCLTLGCHSVFNYFVIN